MPSLTPPDECRSMTELRAQIDRLDRQLISLLVDRAGYIDRAAQLKPEEGLPARIPERVEEVVRNVRATALDAGLDPELAEQLWRVLIDWSIDREARVIGAE
ncbi:chorismate mutase [Cribrihabitans marinus]|uniref:chorismate mutase n=1 Tax=Cribrihabitans marinus TaxID=1227549 RepID=A0A1H7AK42_9RHOB|nr:chorismate mutase [Cribrihabitans marinus]GGH31960.1 chorismate mutase [Cribrihabitans marinus]SEJ65969.1 chorismate mutase [Cribrihabitans marinus]